MQDRLSVDLNSANPTHRRAQEALGYLNARAADQTSQAQALGAQARSGLQAVYAQARAAAAAKITDAHTNLTAAIQSKQAEAATLQTEQSNRTAVETEAGKAQMMTEAQTGAEQTNALGERETARAEGQSETTAAEAERESQNRAANQSGGILGRLKATAFGRLAAPLARSIFDGLSRTVNAVRQIVDQVIDSILNEVIRIAQAVTAAVSATINALSELAHSVVEQLGSFLGQLGPSLNRVQEQMDAKFDQSHALANEAMENAEGSALGHIHEIHGGSVFLIEEVITYTSGAEGQNTSGEPESQTAGQPGADDEISGALDRIVNDADAALGAVGEGFANVTAAQEGGARNDGANLMTTLEGGLTRIANGIVSKLTEGGAALAGTLRQVVDQALGMMTNIVSAVQRGVSTVIATIGQHVSAITESFIGDARTKATSPQVFAEVEQRTQAWFNSQPGASLLSSVSRAPVQAATIQRNGGFWSGVGGELADVGRAILMLFLAAVALVVIACIPIIGPILAAIAVIALVGLLIWGLLQPFIEQWNRMEQVGVPVWLRVILVPFIGFADLIGAIPLLEGIFGIELPTGRALSAEERGRRITRGIIDLILTFGTAGIGRALRGVGVGARAARGIGWIERGLEAIRRLRWVEEALEGLRRLFGRLGRRRTPPVPGSGGAGRTARSAAEILMPGGAPVGRPGASSGIRRVDGGLPAAEQMFDELAAGGRDITPAGYPGRLVELPGGGRVGLRRVSSSADRSPAIDVNIPGIPVNKIHFE